MLLVNMSMMITAKKVFELGIKSESLLKGVTRKELV